MTLLDINDLDLEIDNILASIAAGDNIGLTVLDTEGNLVAPGDCNITADGYALNDPQGISIGGNQITGLGDGTAATAGELDAIAFGNGASTAVGATGAIAIGTDASATAVNSVALGAGSIADRGPLTDYTAAFLSGTFDSVGSVSVGAPGAFRQITNVAPGTDANDAATVGQVQAAIDSVNEAVANAVQYDADAQARITLNGVDGTVIANLADGEVSATSNEAVNGSQLFATNELVAVNTAAIAGLDVEVGDLQANVVANTGDIADLEVDVAANTADIADLQVDVADLQVDVAANTGDIADLQVDVGDLQVDVAANTADIADLQVDVAANTGDIADLQVDVAANTADIAELQDNAVMYDDASHETITLDGADGTTITNVAAGDVSATSTDAVNGSQLFATNQAVDALDDRVTENETNIAANTTAIVDLSTQIGGQQGQIDDLEDRVTVNEGDIANLDGRVTINEGDIADLDGRVTIAEGDIADLDGRVTIAEGDIADLDGRVTINEGDIASLDGRVTINEGDIATIDNRLTITEGEVVAIDARVTDNFIAITNVQAQVDNVPVGYVSDTDPLVPSDVPTDTAAFFSASGGPVTVTNVAAGTVAAGSTDAVNGAQLAATNEAVAENRADIDQNTADIVTINNNLAGSTVVAVQYSDPDNPTVSNGGTITNEVTLVGADTAIPVRLHNVAAGTASTDAVNLGQLQTGLADVLVDSRAYTDERFDLLASDIGVLSARMEDISFDLAEAREEGFAGTAGAMAVAGIPQTIEPGRSMVGGGIGHYRGETAFAIGFSTTVAEGRGVIKAGGTVDTHGRAGFNAGAGFSF